MNMKIGTKIECVKFDKGDFKGSKCNLCCLDNTVDCQDEYFTCDKDYREDKEEVIYKLIEENK